MLTAGGDEAGFLRRLVALEISLVLLACGLRVPAWDSVIPRATYLDDSRDPRRSRKATGLVADDGVRLSGIGRGLRGL